MNEPESNLYTSTSQASQPQRRNPLTDPKNWIITLVIFAIAGAAFYFLFAHWHKSKEEAVPLTQAAIAIPAVKIESRTLFREDQLPAEIDAYQDVLMYPKVPGFVKWLGVDRDSVVKTGQLMASMYAPEY